MNLNRKLMVVLLGCFALCACEKTGRTIDKAVEKAGDKIEEAGDKIERSTDHR